ncbi:MAG: hypothetical protein HC923_04715 [Myxococcales bacterium]|nr:hypothetical protein [Myxococcales bacterium]
MRDEEIQRARQYLIGTHAIAQQSGAAVLVGLVIAGCNSSEDRLRDEVKESVAAIREADAVGDAFASAVREHSAGGSARPTATWVGSAERRTYRVK